MDGTHSGAIYKFKGDENIDLDSPYSRKDEFIITTAFTPLMIHLNNEPFWISDHPNSAKHTRPLIIEFGKENFQRTNNIKTKIENDISMISSEFQIGDMLCRLEIDYKFTMLDGQAVNHVNGTKGTRNCYICGQSGQSFLDNMKPTNISSEKFKFGLKPLHSMLRIVDKLLKIAYNNSIFKFKAREVPKSVFNWMNEQNKLIIQTTKQNIHIKFYNILKLDVDRPRPGFGSTNDGNMAKKIFENFSISANILGINEHLIKELHLLFRLCYSKDLVDSNNFQSQCDMVHKLWRTYLPEETITPSLHLLLCHGNEILPFVQFRPGLYAEEGLESLHKDVRRYRLNNAVKINRKANLEQTFSKLYIRSSVLINEH